MKKQGFLLITTLLIIVVMVLVGMGLMSSQSSRYQAAMRQIQATQARQVALAGLEDARAKLDMDICFPPPPAGNTASAVYYTAGAYAGGIQSQPVFNYSETLIIPPGSVYPNTIINGTYAVTINSTNCIPNFWLNSSYPVPAGVGMTIEVTSIGTIGNISAPTSQYQVKGELDASLLVRGTANPNPRYFYYTHIEDQEIP